MNYGYCCFLQKGVTWIQAFLLKGENGSEPCQWTIVFFLVAPVKLANVCVLWIIDTYRGPKKECVYNISSMGL